VAVAAALGTTVVVVLLATLASVVLTRNEYGQLDRRLATVADVVIPQTAAGTVEGALLGAPRQFLITVRTGGRITASSGAVLPAAGPGYATVDVNGRAYRVLTAPLDGRPAVLVSVAAPTDVTRSAVSRLRRGVLVAGLGAVALAAALGWVFGGRAVRPLRQLAEGARTVGKPAGAPSLAVHGAREAEELAAEINEMLARLQQAHQRTDGALHTAREFAAAAEHELRTPLTALRTDLDVLGLQPPISDGERQQVVVDLLRTHGRLQDTLTALGQLASGELTNQVVRSELDVTELLHRAAHDTRRVAHDVQVVVADGPAVLILGWPAGLRLAVDNLVSNAVRHGMAARVVLAATATPYGAEITVDDDGRGVPESERSAVFTRFARGSEATAPGSGLGLALVAQQAALHGGWARLETSPLGGTRAVLTIAGPACTQPG
jgi:two-component system sensor histidine kinase PrrB